MAGSKKWHAQAGDQLAQPPVFIKTGIPSLLLKRQLRNGRRTRRAILGLTRRPPLARPPAPCLRERQLVNSPLRCQRSRSGGIKGMVSCTSTISDEEVVTHRSVSRP